MIFVRFIQILFCFQLVFGRPLKIDNNDDKIDDIKRSMSLEFYQHLAKNFLQLSLAPSKLYKGTTGKSIKNKNRIFKEASYWQKVINLFRNSNHGQLEVQ